MRTLGASRAQINRAHLAEFTIIGAAAGFVAAAGATGLGWFVAVRFLQLDYVPDPAVWLIGILGGAGGVALAGYHRHAAGARRRAAQGAALARLTIVTGDRKTSRPLVH